MALNQFKHNLPEPVQIDDMVLKGTNSTLNAANATITNLTATNATVTAPLLFPKVLTGNYTIGADYNGLLAGPINVTGSIVVNGVLVVV